MPAPALQPQEQKYSTLWDKAGIEQPRLQSAKDIANKIIQNKTAYLRVQAAVGTPWFMVGAIHNRESALSFRGHLHNGDSLTARTTHVPAGRPASGNPPFAWEASAVDALTMPPHSLNKVAKWSVERILYEEEKYNGWGYVGRGNSPYLWSWTTAQTRGKYVADGVFNPNVLDTQAGCVAIMKELAALDPDAKAKLQLREFTAPPEVVDDATKKSRTVRKVGVGGGAASGAGSQAVPKETPKTGTEVPAKPPANTATHYVLYGGLALGIVVVIVATVMIARTKATIAAKWG